tara:strand:+ start:8330 stop:9121 length:792 start_codon:yes stop_codon:yes gene_type:complete
MLHLLIATHTEAKPLIDNFKLKKKKFDEFSIYWNKNKNISLTITGIGKVNSASSVSYTASIFGFEKNNIWLNIGICGHKNFKIGDIFLVNKTMDRASTKVWFPSINIDTKIKQVGCITLDKIETKYENMLFDMELSGIQQSALKFSSIEFIHSLKIVSDNEKISQKCFYSKDISDLILNKMDEIEEFMINIFILNDKFMAKNLIIEEIIKMIKRNNFKKNHILRVVYLLKRMELYNRKYSIKEISKFLHNPQKLIDFLNFIQK